MITATTKTETKIPIPNPALKIPSITEQLVTKNDADNKVNIVVNLFFIIVCFNSFYKFH